ncbi:MAG: AraC family transcriptional regulator ligand-binding domain-containing protein [Verrucomicrobiae bacterium]|nr:AraC family transcriptional regulator ligand-binding domain-containing protein [Verrucomicrobiae bacterium]
MASIPLTRVATLSPFCRVLQEGGFEVVRSLERSGIPPALLRSPERFVPLRRAAEFVEQTARREGIRGLGFHVGSETTLGELGEFGRIINQALTLHDALNRFIRAMPEADTGARAWTDEVPGRDSLRFCFRQNVDVGKSIVDGYTLTIVIGIIRMAAGRDWRPARVRVAAHPRDAKRVECLAETRIEIVADHGAVEIPRELLALPFQPEVSNAVDTGDWHEAPGTLIGELKETIRNGFGARVPDLVEAAELAGTSVRSLQRQLKQEGAQFRELVDRIRHQEARRLLADPSVPIAGIGRHLGYPDAANFTHAFLRWTGETPSACRARLPA